jgi:F-type H+-transporting ATPase subunit a
VASPLEQFEIKSIIPAALGGFDISFTNSSLWMVIALTVITVFVVGGMSRATVIPGRWQAAVESFYDFIRGMAHENIGPEGRRYVPFLFALFMFVLACNVLGMIPGSFTVTSHIAVTAALAVLVFLIVLIIGFARHGLHFFSLFWPKGSPAILNVLLLVPIEIISFVSRPITLAIRLFANMTAGHVLLKVFAGFIISLGVAGGWYTAVGILPLAMNVALTALELLVACIQAYVFALLTSIYLNDAVNLH